MSTKSQFESVWEVDKAQLAEVQLDDISASVQHSSPSMA